MIKVIDSIMGSGKTSYIIQMMNETPDKKYIYITPYLKQVDRIKLHCKDFYSPETTKEGGVKLESFNKLLMEGKNIASTHALFKLSNKQTYEELKKWDYTLVIDEVMEVVSNHEITKDDLKLIIKGGLAHIEKDTGYLKWDDLSYTRGEHTKAKILCQNNSIVVVNEEILVWTFPAQIFDFFNDVYICTYMFDAQIMRYYLELHNLEYVTYRIITSNNKYELLERPSDFIDDTSKFRVKICQGKKNNIGTFKVDKKKREVKSMNLLSYSWYEDATKDELKRIKKNMIAFFKNDLNRSPSDKNLWTVFDEYKDKLKGSPYTKGFAPCNARATNDYRHKTAVAYVINRFMRPHIKQFFKHHNITITKEQEERYALSELLQFLFRSALREGHDVNLYIPAARMRYILQDWLGIPRVD